MMIDPKTLTLEKLSKFQAQMTLASSALDTLIDSYEAMAQISPGVSKEFRDFGQILLQAQKGFQSAIVNSHEVMRTADRLMAEMDEERDH